MKSAGLILAIFWAFAGAQAQTPWEIASLQEVKKILIQSGKLMNGGQSFSMDIEHRVTDLKTGKLVQQSSGYFQRKDSLHIKSRLFGIETIQNHDLKVVIDSSDQTVLVTKPSGISSLGQLNALDKSLDVTEAFIERITKKRMDNGFVQYRLEYKDAEEGIREINFSVSDDLLLREYSVDLLQKDEETGEDQTNRISFLFSNHQLDKRFADKVFSTSHVVSHKNQRITLEPNYSKFELINTYR